MDVVLQRTKEGLIDLKQPLHQLLAVNDFPAVVKLLHKLCRPESLRGRRFTVDFFGQRYSGDIANWIDWNVYFTGAFARNERRHHPKRLREPAAEERSRDGGSKRDPCLRDVSGEVGLADCEKCLRKCLGNASE